MHSAREQIELLPVVVIVGRANVGKSTLFNALTRTRDALVADVPGLTRDRRYGIAEIPSQTGTQPCVIVDTGGLGDASDAMAKAISAQALRAIDEADAVVFVVDAREGLGAADQDIASRLRRSGKPVTVAVNKTEGLDADVAIGEFHALALGEPRPISASHRLGVSALLESALASVPASGGVPTAADAGVRIAVVGRPNVGKSTLINRLLGDERLVAHDAPGTTRDSIAVPFRHAGRDYTLVDTAGIRRRGRVSEAVEKVSVIKSLQSMAAADVVIVVMDGGEGITDRDTGLIGTVLDAGRALVIAINKCDRVDRDAKRALRSEVDRKLGFLDYVAVHYVSARKGTGLSRLLASVDEAWRSASRHLRTSELNEILNRAIERNPPPVVRGRRIKLRYAHQGGSGPPLIVVHGNQTDALPSNYRRYLARAFRERLRLRGTPVRLEFRSGENPFSGRRNPLTARQQRRRKRLVRHARRK